MKSLIRLLSGRRELLKKLYGKNSAFQTDKKSSVFTHVMTKSMIQNNGKDLLALAFRLGNPIQKLHQLLWTISSRIGSERPPCGVTLIYQMTFAIHENIKICGTVDLPSGHSIVISEK